MPGVEMLDRMKKGFAFDFFLLLYDSYLWTKEVNLGVLDGRDVQRKILDWELPSVHRHRAVDRGVRGFKVRCGKAYLERRLMAVEGHLERAYHRWIQRGELSIREQETTNK